MRKIVIDTNVFISALQSQLGASYHLLQMIGSNKFETCISVPLILEYEAVANRILDRIMLNPEDIADIINYICKVGKPIKIFYLWRPFLNDPNDDMVLEVAFAGGCDTIITFNIKDFKGIERLFGIRIMTPRQFLIEIGALA